MTFEELKPCPFCGGKAEFVTFQPSYMQVYCIRCTKCGMTTGTSHEKLSVQAKKWDRRKRCKMDKETLKYYQIYGYDSNFNLGGSHSQPLLSIVKAKNKAQAEEYANTLSRYNSWHRKGRVVEVKVVDLVGEDK